MILKLILLSLSLTCFAQTSFKPLIDKNELNKESMARSIFIRAYLDSDTKNAIKASGIILKDGYLLTNEHVMRHHLEGKKVAYQIFTNGKTSFHKFEEVKILGCNKENDLCLLKTAKTYNDSYFSLDSPSFRKITPEQPVGLFKDELIFFNGFCNESPKQNNGKYVDYTKTAYERKVDGLENRHSDTSAIQFSSESGEGIACGGDSGGPLYDANLYLYGIVRDSISYSLDNKKKNFAVPITEIRNFFYLNKDKTSDNKIQTIMGFSELEVIFKK